LLCSTYYLLSVVTLKDEKKVLQSIFGKT
jgi:hypothetical protein